ncbi:sensor histidine kinase [Pigmentiphaga aceris]|uniref:sensor histidine kinase n=1 Tax=Pigmentiphaga aceris TaxID=1940612 RepID=UPI0016521DD1|nr:ATP-binding protein [Pigmentiphaga aceris]
MQRRFLVMVAPWVLALVVGFPLLWIEFRVITQAPQWHARESLLEESLEIMRRTLDSLQHDISFLRDLSTQIPRMDASSDSPIARLFVSFANSTETFDTVRWIDQLGNERLRVDVKDGIQTLAAQDDLHDLRNEAYFKRGMDLPPGGILFSEIALNLGRDAVEGPVQPIMRVATPFCEGEDCEGVLVINYRASRILSRLNLLAERQGLKVYLVNAAGYWLHGPTPDQSWGWQRGAPSESSMAKTHPLLWQAMQQNEGGRHQDASGDWAYRHLKLDPTTSVDRETPTPLVSELGLTVLVQGDAGLTGQARLRWEIALIGMMILVLVVALRYASHTVSSLIDEARQSRELQSANRALSEANDNLQRVQADLARAERLSSLGLMVAGVAHELNTPLGSANLSLSTLKQSIGTLRARIQSGLKRSDLDSFIDNANTAAELTQAAVIRAAGLVQRFKQVAVDRTAMERRAFDLAEVILDADPRLRKWDEGNPIGLRLELQEGLQMVSYPGPLEQAVSNLLVNALIHAFRGRETGTITLQAKADGPKHVLVRVIDDGNGIDKDHLSRIFDPFFTTSRHEGGTGLGLHIVSQLVAEVLGGTLEAENIVTPRWGTGARFTMRLPREAPMQVVAQAED